MKITTLQGEKTVREFVRRIFNREPPLEAERVARFEEALKQANPILSGNVSKIPRGTVIRLPKGIDLVSPLEGHSLDPIARPLIKQLQKALKQDLPSRHNKKIIALEAKRVNDLELLRSSKFQQLGEQVPDAKLAIANLVRRGEESQEEIKKIDIQTKQILEELQVNFEVIRNVLQ